MNKKEAGEFIKQIAAAYPNIDFYPDRIKIWTEMLADIEYDMAVKRLKNHIATVKFAPVIADILNPGDKEHIKSNFIDEETLREQRGW